MRHFLFLIALLAAHPARAQLTEVTYRVHFHATWSSATHPEQFPTNAHFSGLIGATHDGSVQLWKPSDTASPGIEQMAETGGKTLLRAEIDNLVLLGQARTLIDAGGIGTSPGDVVTAFTIHDSHPFVSLVSMVAPSPDWFVGVAGLSLMREGLWVDSLTVDLVAWDAGTDSGETYTAADSDTQPRLPISALTTPPFLVGDVVPTLGSFTFLCQSGCLTSTAAETLPDSPDLFLGPPWPNPSSGMFSLDVDASADIQLEVFDALGRTVLHQSAPTLSGRTRLDLDGSALPPGIYGIRIRSRNGMSHRSIVIAR